MLLLFLPHFALFCNPYCKYLRSRVYFREFIILKILPIYQSYGKKNWTTRVRGNSQSIFWLIWLFASHVALIGLASQVSAAAKMQSSGPNDDRPHRRVFVTGLQKVNDGVALGRSERVGNVGSVQGDPRHAVLDAIEQVATRQLHVSAHARKPGARVLKISVANNVPSFVASQRRSPLETSTASVQPCIR